MQNFFTDHTNNLEKNFIKANNIKLAILLILRHWQAFRYAPNDTEARAHIGKAHHIAITMHRRNASHIEMYVIAIFIAIEAGHFDSANEMLDAAMGYKSFLRSSAPHQYAKICFLYAYLEICQKRTRSAKKYWRALTEHVKDAPSNTEYLIMQGLLHLSSGEHAEAIGFLRDAYRAGSRSIFMFEGMFRYFNTVDDSHEKELFLATLMYVSQRGIDITELAQYHQALLFSAAKSNVRQAENLYELSGYPLILEIICTQRIVAGDVSRTAYAYYKEAEKSQVVVTGLFDMLIKAAFANNIDVISHYAMVQFLKNADMESDLAVYVCHKLLTLPHLSDLVSDYELDILKLAEYCLNAEATGQGIRLSRKPKNAHENVSESGSIFVRLNEFPRQSINSLYYFYWQKNASLATSTLTLAKIEEILYYDLTKFEITVAENVQHIYITEPEKQGMIVYDMKNSLENTIAIEATSEDLMCTCLGSEKRTIVDGGLSIRRAVQNVGVDLYLYFFSKGDRRFYLLTYLTNYYLTLDVITDAAIPVFEAMLAEKSISKRYRSKILVALGDLHYNAFSFEQALACYKAVDDEKVDTNFIEKILSVYMQTGEIDCAVNLLVEKHAVLSFDCLASTINILLARPIDHVPLAEAAYRLFLSEEGRGYNDSAHQKLLDLIINHYNASYEEWVALVQILGNPSIPQLDIKIVNTAIWMTKWDSFGQAAFVRLVKYVNEMSGSATLNSFTIHPNTAILQYIEYATYELLANNARPDYDTLDILEDWCMKGNANILLIWALATCYLRHNIESINTDEIITQAIEAMEEMGILFPIFKENRAKRIPFIEKFQPFLFRGEANRNYKLCYRIDNESAFTSISMQYIKYGIYVVCLPLFYNEEVTYYFSEELETGSVDTKSLTVKNTIPFLHDCKDDGFFAINNALIYEQMFKLDQVEKSVNDLVKDIKVVRARLL